jgi:chromate transporter
MASGSARGDLRSLALLFLKLGTIGFGGPAAHIALMREEVVERRGWMSAEHFLDLVGATNLIPGPNSTELAIHIGRERAGWKGLLVSGSAFMAPAALIVLALAWLYVEYGETPAAENLLYGIAPVMVAIIADALWKLTRTAAKSLPLIVLGVAVFGLYLFGINELLLLGGAALLTTGVSNRSRLSGGLPVILITSPVVRFAAAPRRGAGTAALEIEGCVALVLAVVALVPPESLLLPRAFL